MAEPAGVNHARCSTVLIASAALSGCMGSATARLELANQTATPAARSADANPQVLADGTSLRLKLISVSLAPDVDPVTMDNIGESVNIWLNPECQGDNSGCNVTGFAQPAGPRITQYFDLSRPTADVNAELNSQDATITPGTYRYARVELCKALGGQTQADVPTLMWKGPGMAAEQPFVSGDCGRTSLPFDPPLTLAAGDAVTISLGYDLAAAIVAGPPTSGTHCSLAVEGHDDPSGEPHCFRTCVDTAADHRVCMDFPELAPGAMRR
jgi:hypothetical protein